MLTKFIHSYKAQRGAQGQLHLLALGHSHFPDSLSIQGCDIKVSPLDPMEAACANCSK